MEDLDLPSAECHPGEDRALSEVTPAQELLVDRVECLTPWARSKTAWPGETRLAPRRPDVGDHAVHQLADEMADTFSRSTPPTGMSAVCISHEDLNVRPFRRHLSDPLDHYCLRLVPSFHA